ncbi:MAG: metalloregulator ArsR/SmtB family transcription factor [Dissulfuribacterales bacterium]
MTTIQDLELIFKALSDTNRLKLLKLLEEDERCVCALVEAMGMRQSHVSFHLGVLKKAGFLNSRKCGKWQNYSLNYKDRRIRFLLFSVLEQISLADIQEEHSRLTAFLQTNKVQIAPKGGTICKA